jgi:hypothetical protein
MACEATGVTASCPLVAIGIGPSQSGVSFLTVSSWTVMNAHPASGNVASDSIASARAIFFMSFPLQ